MLWRSRKKCFHVFSEIDALNTRLFDLGIEAKLVLAQMIIVGLNVESVTPLVAKVRKAERAKFVKEVQQTNNDKRCKWFNLGFCRENESCLDSHQSEDF